MRQKRIGFKGPGKSPKNLDDASVSLLPRGSAGWTNTTRILLQTCNTIVPFYRPGGVNRLVAFPNRQHRLILIAAQQRYNGRVESLSPRLTRGGTKPAISAGLFFFSRRRQRRRCGTSQPQAQHVVISAHRLILCVARRHSWADQVPPQRRQSAEDSPAL